MVRLPVTLNKMQRADAIELENEMVAAYSLENYAAELIYLRDLHLDKVIKEALNN